MVVLGGVAVSYERGTPVTNRGAAARQEERSIQNEAEESNQDAHVASNSSHGGRGAE